MVSPSPVIAHRKAPELSYYVAQSTRFNPLILTTRFEGSKGLRSNLHE